MKIMPRRKGDGDIPARERRDQTAEKILTALKDNQETGLTRTEIRDLFDRHISNEKLNAALSLLLENGLAEPRKEETKGRPREIFIAKAYAKNDINDKSFGMSS